MLSRQRVNTLFALALPILGGMFSGNILSLVDTAMVGQLGDASLAAVGLGGMAMSFAISVVFGLSAAVQTLSARRAGAAAGKEAVPLNGGLLIATSVGPLAALLYTWLTPAFYGLAHDDPLVAQAGIPYLEAMLWSLPALGFNFAFRGFWQGIGRPTFAMSTGIVIHIVNIVLNYLLIFGKFGLPRLETQGAGLASCLAAYTGTAIYAYLTWREGRAHGFLTQIPAVTEFKQLLSMALPTGAQNILMGLGGLTLLYLIGLLGTAALAAGNVLLRVTRVLLFPGVALGFAARTLVSQAIGRGDHDNAKNWGWDSARVGFLALTLLGLPLLLLPHPILGLFISEPETLALAIPPARLMGCCVGFAGLAQMIMYPLQGAGDNLFVMLVAVAWNWLYYLPMVYLSGIYFEGGLLAVFASQASYGIGMTLTFMQRWRGGAWMRRARAGRHPQPKP